MLPRTATGYVALVAFVVLAASSRNLLAYDTIGNGFGSKWGASPDPGTGAIVTWGFMPDGTALADDFVFGDAITGTSNVTALRNSVDANYGDGAFNTAIQNAFNTWSAVANITFVGPISDPGLPVAGEGATTPHIRIGAFQAIPGQWFDFTSAIGIGPPGPFFEDPFSGDVIFNVDGIGMVHPYQIAPGQEDVTPVDVFQFGDDVEGLFHHELGHAAIGLNHPRWAGEDPDRRVMYVGDDQTPSAPFCCQAINRRLLDDDIAAAQYVYGIRGDYDRSGIVDAADFVTWKKTAGTNVTSGTVADGNIDGNVDTLDYGFWRSNFGNLRLAGFGDQPSFGAGAAAPEPHARFISAILAGLTACRIRKQR